VLRPVPSAMIGRLPGASWPELLKFHRDRMEQMRSQGHRFIEGISFDQAVQSDREYYQGQVAHWVETGLLVPDHENGAA
jgi:hypothetical protein